MISISFILSPQGASRGAPAQERFRALCGEHHGRGRVCGRLVTGTRAKLGILHGKWMNILDDQWTGLRENLQESPIFNGKIYGFL